MKEIRTYVERNRERDRARVIVRVNDKLGLKDTQTERKSNTEKERMTVEEKPRDSKKERI